MNKKYTTYKFLDLHFCFEERGQIRLDDVKISSKDRIVLQELARQIAEIASLPIQEKRKEMWKKLNNLEPVKPMIWLDEVCWHEMDVNDELLLRTTSGFCDRIEAQLLQTLYQWRHMQGDMVVEPVVYSPLAIYNSGVGLEKESEVVFTDEKSDIVSRHFIIQIKNEDDIEKIRFPEIVHDKEQSDRTYELYQDIFGGILRVEKRGAPGFWFAPWDDIVMLTGVQEALLDLATRPHYIHALVEKLLDVALHVLRQYEDQNLLSLNNYNVRVGSGGYGYTEELPQQDFDSGHVRGRDMWGCAVAQIFSDVSPVMHEEFALQYESKWLENFGLNYYGCCEPLHKKIDILRKLPNLRKISMSPFIDIHKATESIRDSYVFSLKPFSAILATDRWDPGAARKELKEKLEVTQRNNCRVEVIMKDISTVRYEPQRLWEWLEIASEVTAHYA